ncbi:MAG: hypothetical protein GF329_02715 [Candidatus Lokiarchaeota archaeon]|nr:hypothetical protein [Candidatus Lokiarchaeota archaeon]
MVLDSIFDVHSVYILKDGVPIFHWSYAKEHGKDLEVDTKDSALISGFLSAIVNFANEMGVGEPKSYLTNDLKFSFLNKKDFLFVILVDKDISDEKTFDFLNIVSKTFIKLYDVGDFKNVSAINFDGFKDYLFEIITKVNSKEITEQEINEKEIIENQNIQERFKKLVPKCYIDVEKTERISSARRALFKLIDGSSSIYKIAQKINDTPQNLFYTLRPYEKFGYIRIRAAQKNDGKPKEA